MALDLDLVGATYAFGPLAVLSAMSLSLVSSAVWSRNVGEASCAWRTDYSPDGRAFVIWGVIYTLTVGTVIAELTGQVPVFEWWVHFFWALAWVCCALWVPLFDAEYPGALRAAMLQILAGAACATVATWRAEAWSSEEKEAKIGLVVPLTLLAGWLLTASSINVGIAWKASQKNALRTCVVVPPRAINRETEDEYRERRRVLYREQYAKAPAVVSFVPMVLAVGVGGLAVLIRDPVLTIPLMWAIVNLKAFPSCVYMAVLLVCACGTAGAVVRIFMF